MSVAFPPLSPPSLFDVIFALTKIMYYKARVFLLDNIHESSLLILLMPNHQQSAYQYPKD